MQASPWQLVKRNRDFRFLWSAQLVSMSGDFMNQVALSALVFTLTGSALDVSLLVLATNLPYFISMPVSGTIADRFDRRRTMIFCDLSRAVLILGLLAVQPTGWVWLALLNIFIVETISSIFDPTSAAALPNLVSKDELPAANELSSASFGVTMAVGAAIGGWLATHKGVDATIAANSLAYLSSAFLLSRVRGKFSEERAKVTFSDGMKECLTDFREGLAYARGNPRVISLLFLKGFWGLGTGIFALLTVMPMQIFKAGTQGVSVLFGARGVGAFCGPFLAQFCAPGNFPLRAHLAALGILLTGLFWAGFGGAPSIWLAALLVVAGSASSGLVWVLSTSLLQQITEDRIRGRVMALDFGQTMLSMACSTLVYGFAIDKFGAREVGIGGGALMVALAVLWMPLFSKRWRKER